ncbi:MAG TPA: glutathione S-transferase family protein [Caulobacteraceae bacterium]|nr:glutathione S-transferase family protein [Caulobacteraceae bacterium]
MAGDLVLYRSVASRSIVALWLLEELGVPYRTETYDIARGETRSSEYLALNPRGTVPMIVDGETKVTETAAICLYLADRYGYGTLAPRLEAPERGPYMSWIVWATAVLEPASTLVGHEFETKRGSWGFGFGSLDRELEVLEAALAASGYVAGRAFTAADVIVGAVVAMRLQTGELPPHPVLTAYADRNAARPAFDKAAKLNWPPELFGPREVKDEPAKPG